MVILLIIIIIIIIFIIITNIIVITYFFFMSQVKDQQSHSLHLSLAYFIFATTIFRLIVFKFYDFVILLWNHRVKSMKNVAK